MRNWEQLRALRVNQRGNVLAIAAAAMPLIIGSASLAVETMQLSLMKRHMQRAADSGALAGAFARVQGKSVRSAVDQVLGFNDAFPLASSIVQNSPTSGDYANNDRAVRVILTAQPSLPLWSFFSSKMPTLRVEATAALVYTGEYCMVALDESSGTGVTFSGNSTVNLGCGVISNTSGSSSVVAEASSQVTASPVAAVGGIPSSNSYVQPTLLLPYSLKQKDPFATLPTPAPAGCKTAVVVNSSLGPGCYKGLDVKGTLNLTPGTYYIAGGPFTVNANARLKGSGVTLVFTSETPGSQSSYPAINVNGSSVLELSAPTSGTYEGILMQYDQRSQGGSHLINGNSFSTFEGSFYFPRQHLTFNGNSGMTTNCIQLVAYKLTFTGNTEINNDCSSEGGAKAFSASWVRLVD